MSLRAKTKDVWQLAALATVVLNLLSLFINQGPYNISIVLSLIVTILFISLNRPFYIEQLSKHKLFFYALFAYMGLYALLNLYHLGLTSELTYAVKRMRWVAFSLLLLPVLPNLIFNDKKLQANFIRFSVIGLSIISLLIFYDTISRLIWSSPTTSLWFKSSLNNNFGQRASWTYNPIPFSKMAVFASGFLACVAKHFDSKKKYFIYSISILLLAVSILSLTRATWVALVLCFPLILIYLKNKKLFLSLMVFVVLALFSLAPSLKDRLSSIKSTTNFSNKYRIEHFKANIKVFTEHPILGIGYGKNRSEETMKSYMNVFHKNLKLVYGHPHNEYLDILVGMGLLAFIIFIFILFYPIYYKLTQTSFYSLNFNEFSAMFFLLYIYITALFDKITLTSWTMIIFCWAVMLFYTKIPKSSQKSAP